MNYIAYYRTSTKRQNLGLEAQRKVVNDWLMANGGNLIGEFSEKESGKNNNRIELNKAIKACQKEDCQLLIAKLDRLSRCVSFIFALRDSNVNFIACDLPEFNTMTLAIFSGLAQQERELISQRTKLALEELKRKGKKLGNPNATFSNEIRAIAYKRLSENAEANLNNRKASSMIKALLYRTLNLSEIARELNDNGFVTSRGKQFNAIQVKRIIQRYNLNNHQINSVLNV